MDEHDDDVSQLEDRIQRFITTCSAAPDADARKILFKHLTHVEKKLTVLFETLQSLPERDSDATYLLHQCMEQLSELKDELGDISKDLFALDLADTDDLSQLQKRVEKTVFTCSIDVKKLLASRNHPVATPTAHPQGIKLPKLDIVTFDGNILVHWKTFWEQF